MKKILYSSAATVLPLLAGVVPAYAQGYLDEVGANSGLSNMELPVFIGKIISIALGFLGIIFLGLTLYAGFLWMTAAGDEGKVKTATKLLMQAVVGLVIILAAYAISSFVFDQIQGAIVTS